MQLIEDVSTLLGVSETVAAPPNPLKKITSYGRPASMISSDVQP